jgi:hypothetical protein
MTTEHEARAEAFKRYDGDRTIDENTGVEVSHVDWGYAEMERQAFIAGVEWAAERLSVPPSDDDREALTQAALDSERLRQIAEWFSMEQGHEETAKRVNLIADRLDRLAVGFRRQGPITDDEREALAMQFANLIFEYGLRSPDSTKALIAFEEVAAGFRRQGPITDEMVEAARRAINEEGAVLYTPIIRAALEAAERARSAVPSPTEQESDRG